MADSSLRIAMLGPAPPFRGGISVFATHLGHELSSQDHEVHYFNFISQYPKFLFPGGDQMDETCPDINSERILTPYLPYTWLHTIKSINQYQPDIVLVSWWLPFFAPAFGTILRKLLSTRIIYIAHNIIPHEFWPGTKTLLKYALSPAQKIVVLSKACLDDLKRYLPNSIARKGILGFHPIYNYAKPDVVQRSTVQPDPHTILFFGLIKPYKGLDVLLKAMPLIKAKHPGIKLVIAGAVYGSSAVYEEIIADLGLDSQVERHYRYISDDEIAGFFERCGLCVLPYKSATQSGVIATAYSFDTPVIASNVGGLSEYIIPDQTGFLVEPENPQALADAIIRYIETNSYIPMSANIRDYKRKFGWDELVKLILK